MKIVADENIPLVKELFGRHGCLELLPGRAIDAASVADADALLIRSVTRVDSALIANSRLKFIGSATIGTDHVDLSALASAGIRFANAPGCNANAVAEYVLASLWVLAQRGRFRPGVDVVGILGYGNVGKRLAAKLNALAWPFKVCDPLLESSGIAQRLVSANELKACDVLTLHVPLQKGGPHSTWHWLDEASFAESKARVVINSCRGAVVDNEALLHWLQFDRNRSAVLDVWENEPDVPGELLQRVDIATPHIAGHSREGKYNGSFMIHQAFCEHFSLDATDADQWHLAAAGTATLSAQDEIAGLLHQLLACYDPRRDDQIMREALTSSTNRKATFDQLRRDYPERRELLSWQLNASATIAARFHALATFV